MRAAGWFRASPEAWAIAREELSTLYAERGEPWPLELVEMDGAWMLDQRSLYDMSGGRRGLRRIPGAKKLGKFWGWTEWAARQWLKTEIGPNHASAAQSPRKGRATRDGSKGDIDRDPRNGRATAAQSPRHARKRQTPDSRRQTGESRGCGKVGSGGANGTRTRNQSGSTAGDIAMDKLDPDLFATILRILDNDLDLLHTLGHAHRTDEFVADMARRVREEARLGVPVALPWRKREPGYPEVIRVLRHVANENEARS